MLVMKNHVRDALLTAALFGSLGPALAQTPPTNAGHGAPQPSAQQPPPAGPAVFVDGKLNVPNAPADSSTRPSKFSTNNAHLDDLPTMARGPALTDAQRKLILEHVKPADAAPPAVYAGPSTQLPATAATQPWPADVISQVPSLRGTNYLAVSGKILLVRPDTSIVVGEISR